jgi:anti-anti-sigma factor
MELVSLAYAYGEEEEPPVREQTVAGGRLVRDLRGRLAIRITERSGRVRAAVGGEVDLDCAATLRHVLCANLVESPGGLDIDLNAVRFFDCSGLNVLLHLRVLAREHGIPLRLLRVSPAVSRVLTLTDTAPLFFAESEAA